MTLRHSELVEVRAARKKGRGVFARANIRRGRVIERVPVIVMKAQEISSRAARTLDNYVFIWGHGKVAFACGYGSLYNHSFQPNALYYPGGLQIQVFAALRDIKAGEEITVNYNGGTVLGMAGRIFRT